MSTNASRRDALKWAAGLLATPYLPGKLHSAEQPEPSKSSGCVVGQPQAAKVGMEVLASGGNAVDAAVAAALTAGVVALPSCGLRAIAGPFVLSLAGGDDGQALILYLTGAR